VDLRLIYRSLLGGLFSVCWLLPAGAQDSGTEVVFGFRQGLESSDNLDLDPVSLGSTTFVSTELSLGVTHETPLDRFGLMVSGVLRGVNGPSANSGLDDQRLDLTYGRSGVRSGFEFTAGYLQSQIEFLQPLDGIGNEDGDITLPPDLDSLKGTGTRERFQTGMTLELGRDAPVGATFRADHLALRYSDTSDPDLFDNQRSNLETEVRLQLSPVTVAKLGLAYRLYDAVDIEETRRETWREYVGLDVEVSPVLRLEARLGYASIDTREFGVTAPSEGAEGLLRLVRDMPDGFVTVEVEQYLTEDATIRTFSAGRSLELPSGKLAVTLGVADSDLDQSKVIGSLGWSQDLPNGQVSAQLQRGVDFDEEKGNVLRTSMLLNYSYEINSVSSLGFNTAYTVSEDVSDTIDRASFTATYQHALTKDWALMTGYRYQMREELTDPRAQSHSVFFTIGRDFSF